MTEEERLPWEVRAESVAAKAAAALELYRVLSQEKKAIRKIAQDRPRLLALFTGASCVEHVAQEAYLGSLSLGPGVKGAVDKQGLEAGAAAAAAMGVPAAEIAAALAAGVSGGGGHDGVGAGGGGGAGAGGPGGAASAVGGSGGVTLSIPPPGQGVSDRGLSAGRSGPKGRRLRHATAAWRRADAPGPSGRAG